MSNNTSIINFQERQKHEYRKSVLDDVANGGILVATEVLAHTEYMKEVICDLLNEQKISLEYMKLGDDGQDIIVFKEYIKQGFKRKQHKEQAVA